MTLVWGLSIGAAIGAPIGLYATTNIDAGLSKLIALFIILSLTLAQLFKFRPRFLATKPGLYGNGLTAGVVTGLASVGAMVVALYILASEPAAKRIRASLVMFLFIRIRHDDDAGFLARRCFESSYSAGCFSW